MSLLLLNIAANTGLWYVMAACCCCCTPMHWPLPSIIIIPLPRQAAAAGAEDPAGIIMPMLTPMLPTAGIAIGIDTQTPDTPDIPAPATPAIITCCCCIVKPPLLGATAVDAAG
jgi:hypothetical protein